MARFGSGSALVDMMRVLKAGQRAGKMSQRMAEKKDMGCLICRWGDLQTKMKLCSVQQFLKPQTEHKETIEKGHGQCPSRYSINSTLFT